MKEFYLDIPGSRGMGGGHNRMGIVTNDTKIKPPKL